MAANRQINTAGAVTGAAFMGDVAEEVAALWKHAEVPLSNVAGTANAITADCDVPLLALQKGQKFSFIPAVANTGAATIAINGLAARAIQNRDGTAIVSNRLVAGRMEKLEDSGTALRLVTDNPPSSTGTLRSIIAYQTAANANGAAVAAGWNTYPLSTVIENAIPGVVFTPATKRITLPANAYKVEAEIFIGNFDGGVFLYNVTDAALITSVVQVQGGQYALSRLFGSFTLAGTKDVELRVYALAADGAAALGRRINSGQPEQYGYVSLEVAG